MAEVCMLSLPGAFKDVVERTLMRGRPTRYHYSKSALGCPVGRRLAERWLEHADARDFNQSARYNIPSVETVFVSVINVVCVEA